MVISLIIPTVIPQLMAYIPATISRTIIHSRIAHRLLPADPLKLNYPDPGIILPIEWVLLEFIGMLWDCLVPCNGEPGWFTRHQFSRIGVVPIFLASLSIYLIRCYILQQFHTDIFHPEENPGCLFRHVDGWVPADTLLVAFYVVGFVNPAAFRHRIGVLVCRGVVSHMDFTQSKQGKNCQLSRTYRMSPGWYGGLYTLADLLSAKHPGQQLELSILCGCPCGCGFITRRVTVFLPSRMALTILVLNRIGFTLSSFTPFPIYDHLIPIRQHPLALGRSGKGFPGAPAQGHRAPPYLPVTA